MCEQVPLALALATANPENETDRQDAREALDPDHPREVCPHGCGETYCPRGRYHHLQECAALDHSPFEGDAGREVPTA